MSLMVSIVINNSHISLYSFHSKRAIHSLFLVYCTIMTDVPFIIHGRERKRKKREFILVYRIRHIHIFQYRNHSLLMALNVRLLHPSVQMIIRELQMSKWYSIFSVFFSVCLFALFALIMKHRVIIIMGASLTF